MISPSRWFSGGWGLDEFRNKMMNSNKIREIHDYQNSLDCFSGVDIKGGVSYFLYNRDNEGKCKFYTHNSNYIHSMSERLLKEDGCDIIIRYNEMISIYRKVHNKKEFESFSKIVSGRSPYGLNTNHCGYSKKKSHPSSLF